MDFILREEKGSELTHPELDGNFTKIDNALGDKKRAVFSDTVPQNTMVSAGAIVVNEGVDLSTLPTDKPIIVADIEVSYVSTKEIVGEAETNLEFGNGLSKYKVVFFVKEAVLWSALAEDGVMGSPTMYEGTNVLIIEEDVTEMYLNLSVAISYTYNVSKATLSDLGISSTPSVITRDMTPPPPPPMG